jgi:lycopene beta-cyclase
MSKIQQKVAFDYVILGGGAAGLSLAAQFCRGEFASKTVLLIEKKIKHKNDRTWCFWSKEPFTFQSAPLRKWENIHFAGLDFERTESLQPMSYYHLAASDFYAEMHELIDRHPHITYLQEEVVEVKSSEEGAEVVTDQGKYLAKWVFNSIPPRKTSQQAPQVWLKQHFLGYFLRTDQPVFDDQAVTLMDYNSPDPAAFFYILPFSPTHALVEYTAFSPEVWPKAKYRDALDLYIKEKWGVENYEIEQEEFGQIPMTTYLFPRRQGKRILNIGTRGGLTKPTTGYTFKTIQEDSRKIAQALIQTGSPIYKRESKVRYRFYDRLLLDIIEREPEQVKPIMSRLFRQNRYLNILTFLDENRTLIGDLSMIIRLPWGPFFRAIYRQYFQHGTSSPTHQPVGRLADPALPATRTAKPAPLS